MLPYIFFISDFTIANGLLRVVTTLNYEETKSQLITVDAFDGNHTNSTIVNINVLPVNEYDPVFKSNSTVWNVTENSKAEHLCVNVSLTFYFIQTSHRQDNIYFEVFNTFCHKIIKKVSR